MPSWLIPLIKLAIQIGSPYLLELLKKWISKLPVEVIAIINELIGDIKNPDIPNSVAKQAASQKLKDHCEGVACESEIKN